MSGFANYLNARSDTGGMGRGLVDVHDVGAPANPYWVRAGWAWPATDARQVFRRYQKRDPNAAEAKLLAEQIRMIKGGISAGQELTFEHHHRVLLFIAQKRRLPSGYPSNERGENATLVREANDAIWHRQDSEWNRNHPGILGSIVSAIAAPVVGIGHAASAIAQGKNVLQSLKDGAGEMFAPAASIAKTLSPALNVAAGLASFVPGIGTAAASALSVAAALGRGASVGDLALEAARGALPGGAIAKVAFDVAVGIATNQSPTGIALAGIRNQIPGGQVGKAAFDAGLAVAYHAKPAEAAHAARALPKGKARETFAKPVIAAARVRAASPPKIAELVQKRRAQTRARPLTRRAKSWVTRAIKIHAQARLDTRGLNPDGKTYTVERGDSAWKIAQNLTGDGNRHYQELLRANSPPKTLVRDGMTLAPGASLTGANFKFLKTGEVLKIPSTWIGKFVRAASPAASIPVGGDALSLPPATRVAAVQPPPAPPPSPAATVAIPPAPPAPTPPVSEPVKSSANRDDPTAIAQAKAILVAWEHTDGSAAAGLPDYGANTADQSPIWGARDNWELRAFVVWSNAHGTALSLLGDLTQGKLDALVAWAENRAKQIATGEGSASPTGLPPPKPAAPIGATAPGPSPIPVDPGPSEMPSGGKPPVMQAGIIPTELIPETNISGSAARQKDDSTAFGLGIAAIALLGLGVAFSGGNAKNRKKAA